MNILFITRKFPPVKGGMEKVAFDLYTHMLTISKVRLISYGGSSKFLPIVLPSFFARAAWNILTHKTDVVYLQDGLLSLLGVMLKIFGKPIAITIHGLDITYENHFYQYIIPKCVKKLDKIICISNATEEECIKRGIPREKITIIPNGISDEFYVNENKTVLKEQLANKINFSFNDKKILLSVGRLVERKGFHWFVKNVISGLLEKQSELVYIIVGDGKYRKEIEAIIAERGLQSYVKLLGGMDDETLKLLYNTCDIFVMPNIPVKGDIEGFGIVAIEAASCGVPVVASELEGIKDAIVNEKNGFLIEPYNAYDFNNIIFGLLDNDYKKEMFGKKSRRFTLENYNWRRIIEIYLRTFKQSLKCKNDGLEGY